MVGHLLISFVVEPVVSIGDLGGGVVKRFLLLALLSLGSAASAKEQGDEAQLADEQVKQQIIQESIDSYPGNCPCPYNYARNGSRCGKRSAWSRAGGYAPICYKEEITDEMVSDWRGRADN